MNNKPFYLLMIAAASVLLLGSCKENETEELGSIKLDPQEVPVDATSGSFTVNVTSSHEFTVNTPSWISIDPEQDTYQSGTLTFLYEEYTNTAEPRKGNIVFTCLNTRDTLVVTQAAGEDLYLSEFMEYTEPGLYGQAFDSFIYQEFSHQHAVRTYANGNTDYKLISINPPLFINVKSLPSNIEEGSSLSIGLQQNVTTELNTNFFYTINVEKVDGNKIWMYEPTNRFGIIISKE